MNVIRPFTRPGAISSASASESNGSTGKKVKGAIKQQIIIKGQTDEKRRVSILII